MELNKNEFESFDFSVFHKKASLDDLSKFKHGAYDLSKIQAEKIIKIYETGNDNVRKERKILIIYTGGTIGMVSSKNGLVPFKSFLYNYLYNHPNFCDKNYTKNEISNNALEKDILITPLTIYNKRIYYRIFEFENIIDSANMTIKYWKDIGRIINKNYHDYDGFIILHGTDTMNYTASILSFQLENLDKPVILTGAQIPLSEMRNDGIKNLVDSLTIAGIFNIPEVCIMFNGNLYRGNRTIKSDNINYNAFESPNFRPLMEIGISIKVNWDIILPSPSDDFIKDINNNISIVKFFPIITESTFQKFFQRPIEAVIIETYGSGNMSTDRKGILEILKEACNDGIIIVNVSQCRRGLVIDSYETGNILSQIGVIFSGDMTVECALSKLSYLLGKYSDKKVVKKMFCESIKGELTNKQEDHFAVENNSFTSSLLKLMKLDNCEKDNDIISKTIIPTVVNQLVEKNELETLKKMKNEIKNLISADFSKKNPLHISALNGHFDVTKFLIKCRVNINQIDDHHNTPLYYACLKKHKEVAFLILHNGGILNSKSDIVEILCKSAFENDLETIKLFSECGANLMASNYDRRTLAHIAAAEGHIEIIKYLIEINLNLMISDRWGNTPFDEATNDIKKLLRIKFKIKSEKKVTLDDTNEEEDYERKKEKNENMEETINI